MKQGIQSDHRCVLSWGLERVRGLLEHVEVELKQGTQSDDRCALSWGIGRIHCVRVFLKYPPITVRERTLQKGKKKKKLTITHTANKVVERTKLLHHH